MEKRTLKNVVMTRKYHWLYIGKMVTVTLCMVAIIYAYMLAQLVTLSRVDGSFPFQISAIITTTGALVVCALVIYLGMLTAHRVAGPHIQLQNTFDEISNGHLDTRLKFRGGDRLEDVENAFNTMMDTLQARVEAAEKET